MGKLRYTITTSVYHQLTSLQCILRAVGVGGGVAAAGVVETGDVIELWWRFAESVGLA
jgi:hypothetical protein